MMIQKLIFHNQNLPFDFINKNDAHTITLPFCEKDKRHLTKDKEKEKEKPIKAKCEGYECE